MFTPGTPDGYVLKEQDVKLIRDLAYKFAHLQKYVNAFGREPEDKIDHEEMHTSEVYIAHTPDGGIPALVPVSSTGIGDTPGSATCTMYKTAWGSGLTEDVTDYQQEVLNISTTAIDENSWIIVVRDKYGKYYAIPTAVGTSSGTAGHAQGPGWVAGLGNEDCLIAEVISAIGKCSTVPTVQIMYLFSSDGVTWTSSADFIYPGGSGPIVFTRPSGQSMPLLTIDGYELIWDFAGVTSAGEHSIDFAGGTSLCSDGPGSGSGTGGARGACGGNTFLIRIRCIDCLEDLSCDAEDLQFREIYRMELYVPTTAFGTYIDGFDLVFNTALSTVDKLIWSGGKSIAIPGPGGVGVSCTRNFVFQLKVECVENVWTTQVRHTCNGTLPAWGMDIVAADGDVVHCLAVPSNGPVEAFEDPGYSLDNGPVTGCNDPSCFAVAFIIDGPVP